MWRPVPADQAISCTLPSSHSVVIIFGNSTNRASLPNDLIPPGQFDPAAVCHYELGSRSGSLRTPHSLLQWLESDQEQPMVACC